MTNVKKEWYELEYGDEITVQTPNGDDNLNLIVCEIVKVDQAENPNGVLAIQLKGKDNENWGYSLNQIDLQGPFIHYRTEVLRFWKDDLEQKSEWYEKRWTIVEAFVGVMKYELNKTVSKEGNDLFVVNRIEVEPEDSMVYVYNADNQLVVMQRSNDFTLVYGYSEVLLTPEEVAAKTEVNHENKTSAQV